MLQPSTDQTAAVTPEPILKIAMGFMAAKHLFAASEPRLFEALANGPAKLDELAKRTVAPPRTPQERELLFDLLIRIIRQNTAYARPGTGRRKRRPNQARFDKNRGLSATSPRDALSKQE